MIKKYTTPLLAQYTIATEGLMNLSLTTPKSTVKTLNGADADTFEKQFTIWGDDYSDGQVDEFDFNSTGIF